MYTVEITINNGKEEITVIKQVNTVQLRALRNLHGTDNVIIML